MVKIKSLALILVLMLLCGCAARGGDQSSGTQSSSAPASSAEVSSDLPSASSEITPTPTVTDPLAELPNKKICWGQGYNVNDKNQPVSCPQYNALYGKYDAIFMGQNEQNIYLTFDEGYENGYTAQILDTLRDKQVSAVFFVTYDYVRSNPELIRRMIDEGHVVGNHSWSHPSMPDKTTDEVKAEITRLHDYVLDNFGYTMTLFRPPMGEFSERTLAVTQSLGYKTVLWSFAYYDYDVNKQPTEQKAIDRITGAEHGGAVYLLHAVSATNTAVLGQVIDHMRQSGYTVAKFDV
jgi:peptidoglycan-N-acetylmuramic acid deacetylase